ncbi:MAG TPA: hypothetical protein VFV84_12490 [Burkholderiales bacterium]|nr:hypothetical protein [Burkholderiales bacterium]
MIRRSGSVRSQRGFGLLALVAVIVLVFAYVVTSRLNAASRFVAVDRNQNAVMLARAKLALVGYVAQLAAQAGEANPGRLPCPEPFGYYNTANEGIAAANCTLPAVGRLPWRTLGLDKLTDTAGEPLWYVVSPGWALPNSTTPTVINSDSQGQLTIDGAANDSVALIIAPGERMTTAACGGAAAWAQVRPVAGPLDVRNYLECENAVSASFVTSRPGQTFNDQAVRVRAADLMPSIEAAVADRIQREIAPALRTVYTNSNYSGIPSSSPLYPYPAPFSNPGTSSYQGSAALCQSPPDPSYPCQGLLPVNQASSMVAYQSTPGNAVETQGYGYIVSQTCSWESTNDVRICEGVYHEYTAEPWRPIVLRMTATFTNMAMGLRALDGARFQAYARDDSGTPPWSPIATNAPSATMNSDGSVTVRVSATMPNIDAMSWDTQGEFRLRLERAIITDHPLVKSTDPTYGWFTRNQWQRVLYYAAAQKNTAYSLSSFGCGSTNCLRFNEGLGCGSGANYCNIRALMVLGGASLSNASRPNGNLSDYLEGDNENGGTFYEQQRMRRLTNVTHPKGPWNDRVILVDWTGTSLLLTTVNNHPQVVADTSTSPVRTYYLP